jgi:ABC-type transport system substrate-binding protein
MASSLRGDSWKNTLNNVFCTQSTDDGLTWTFILKPNLKFSDGTTLTSHDVVYSIDRALQPATKSSVSPLYLALIKDSDELVAGKIKTIIGDSLLTPASVGVSEQKIGLDSLCSLDKK